MKRSPLLPLAALLLGACEHAASLEPSGRVPVRPVLSVADAANLVCPPLPFVTARAVEPGTEADLNGNGTVCDRDEGTPGLPQITTTDDILIAAPAQ
jgi:hypothetical protein